MQLNIVRGVPPHTRRNAINMLFEYNQDWDKARDIESAVNSSSTSLTTYTDKISQIVFNLKQNTNLISIGTDIVIRSDEEMAEGTIIQDIKMEAKKQNMRFEQIIQENYDKVNREKYRTTLKCKRCGSSDISWEQKQTRGADEAMTVFCTCNKCSQRWVMGG